MINFRILQDKQLIIMCFEGEITPEIVMSFIDELLKTPDYNPEYKSIIDLRRCKLVYDIEGMKRTLEYMVASRSFAVKRKTA
jgi:hypothetical protein